VVNHNVLSTMFTSVAAAIICKLLTKLVVVGQPLAIMWGNTVQEWGNLTQVHNPLTISTELDWYSFQKLN